MAVVDILTTDDYIHSIHMCRRGCWRWSWRMCCSGARAYSGACWRHGWLPSWWEPRAAPELAVLLLTMKDGV
jgi:hypothetical protein